MRLEMTFYGEADDRIHAALSNGHCWIEAERNNSRATFHLSDTQARQIVAVLTQFLVVPEPAKPLADPGPAFSPSERMTHAAVNAITGDGAGKAKS